MELRVPGVARNCWFPNFPGNLDSRSRSKFRVTGIKWKNGYAEFWLNPGTRCSVLLVTTGKSELRVTPGTCRSLWFRKPRFPGDSGIPEFRAPPSTRIYVYSGNPEFRVNKGIRGISGNRMFRVTPVTLSDSRNLNFRVTPELRFPEGTPNSRFPLFRVTSWTRGEYVNPG